MALEPIAVADEVDTSFERPGGGGDHRQRPPRCDATDAHGRQRDQDSDNHNRADDELHDRSFLAENEFHAGRPWRGARSGRTRLARAVAMQRGPSEWRSLIPRRLGGEHQTARTKKRRYDWRR